jgi:mono/diheme cytochrome c family protein
MAARGYRVRMRRSVTAATLLLTVVVAGCGGGDDGGGADPQTLAKGKQIFTEQCGGCHTLQDAGTTGAIGPNLDELQPNEGTVREQVTNGGGSMPAFKGKLSDDEIKAVAAYVADRAGG